MSAYGRLRTPSQPLRVLATRRVRPDRRAGRNGTGPWLARAGPDRPRRHVRRDRLLPGLQAGRPEADRRARGVRRAELALRQAAQDRHLALPPNPPGEGPEGLPEPDPADDARPHRGLLL